MAANSGARAIEVMRERLPDLLLLDLMMPFMNGWELLRHMAQSPDLAAVPVLVLSATNSHGLEEAQDLGAPCFCASRSTSTTCSRKSSDY